MNVLVRGQGHGTAWSRSARDRRKASTWGRAGRSSATCKTVIVDGIDDFLYFRAIMLFSTRLGPRTGGAIRRAGTERTFKHPGSRQPLWWKMLYSHLLELQSMIATTRWRWKCCGKGTMGKPRMLASSGRQQRGRTNTTTGPPCSFTTRTNEWGKVSTCSE
jgi:hypothetical protein